MKFLTDHLTKILGTLQTLVAAMLGAVATDQIPDLIAQGSRGMQILILVNILLGAVTAGVGFNNSAKIKLAEAMQEAIKATPAQGGYARIGFLTLLIVATLTFMSGCATDPATGKRELTATGQIALQEGLNIAARRFVFSNPKGIERAGKIREYAGRLYGATSFTTITDLRATLDAELDKANLAPLDRADWDSFLNLVQVVVTERVGKNELDADAIVKLNDVVAMIVSALPPLPPQS